jgi:hypothetical protein
MIRAFQAFAADEAGAVTVDWVVLTAALVGLGLAVMTVIRTGATNLADEAGDLMCNITIPVAGGAPTVADGATGC